MKNIEPITIKLLSADNTFDQLKDIWQALEKADFACQPFNTWNWAYLWWSHYQHASDNLAILVARQGRQVVAIAPFYVGDSPKGRLLPTRLLRFIGTGGDSSANYMNILALPHARAAAERAILDYLPQIPGWHKLQLSDIVKGSSLSACIRAFVNTQSGYVEPESDNLILRARLPDCFEDYRAQLSCEQTKQINCCREKLDAAGEWRLSICASLDELQEAMEALRRLQQQCWENCAKTGSFAGQNDFQFHQAIIKRFFAEHHLWLTTLRLNNRIIGVQYIFLWRGELQFYQCGLSPEHDSLNPGDVLFTYAIQRAIEQGVIGVDMLKSDCQHKSVYADAEFYTTNHVYQKRGLNNLFMRGKSVFRRLFSVNGKG